MGSVGRRRGEAVNEVQLQNGVSVSAGSNPKLTSEAAYVAAMGNYKKGDKVKVTMYVETGKKNVVTYYQRIFCAYPFRILCAPSVSYSFWLSEISAETECAAKTSGILFITLSVSAVQVFGIRVTYIPFMLMV